MNQKTRPFESTIFRGTFAFIPAAIATNMAFLPFAALVYLGAAIPEWLQIFVALAGVVIAIVVGFRCFRWFYRYFESV